MTPLQLAYPRPEIGDNNERRVVVLTAAGRGLCSGLDLTDPFPSVAAGGVEFPRSSMQRLRQPVIAAVNGPVYGGGFAIALACDIGLSYTLPRIIGAGPAFDLILTARDVDADEASRLGIVSRLSRGSSVLDDALGIAETLCS